MSHIGKGTLGFYQYSRQSYASLLKTQEYYDEVTITAHCDDGGTYGEFNFQWHNFGHNGSAVRMDIFHDAWWMLADPRLATLLTWISTLKEDRTERRRPKAMDPADFCRYLVHLGFKDYSDNPLPDKTS
jgi:hypothetical protein